LARRVVSTDRKATSGDPQDAIAKREIKVELLRIEATLRDISERLSKYNNRGHGSLEKLEDTILDVVR